MNADIDIGAVHQILAAQGLGTAEVFNPAPTCRCVARWKGADGQAVALKIEWEQGDSLATPESIARLFKFYAHRAIPVFPNVRWVSPEATIFLCRQLLEEIV